MGYLYLAVFGLYGVLFLLSGKEKVSAYRDRGGKKSYPGEILFLKAAVWCIRKKGKKSRYRKQMRQSGIGSSLKLLHPELEETYQVQAFYVRQYSLVLLVIFVGSLLSLGMMLAAKGESVLQEGGFIERKTYGQGNRDVILSAQVEGEEAEEIFYTVEERKYTEEEAAHIFREAVSKLGAAVLGDNDSLENVTENLNLMTSMEGYPFQIVWESDDYALVQTDGSVRNEALEESAVVMLTARFLYEEQEFREVFPVRILPAVLTAREQLVKEIEQSLEEQNLSSRTDRALTLPDKIGLKNVIWKTNY